MAFRLGTSCVCESVPDLLDLRESTFLRSGLALADPEGSESSETSDCTKGPPDAEPESVCVSDDPRSLKNLRGMG